MFSVFRYVILGSKHYRNKCISSNTSIGILPVLLEGESYQGATHEVKIVHDNDM